MPRQSQFSKETQKTIKKQMFDGAKNSDLTQQHSISGNMLSMIKRGEAWGNVPWPDGTTGPMAALQADKLKQDRSFTAKVGRNTGLEKHTEEWWKHIHGAMYDEILKFAQSQGFEGCADYHSDQRRQQHEEEERKRDEEIEKGRQARLAYEARRREAMLAQGLDPDAPYVPPVADHLRPIDPEKYNKVPWETVVQRHRDNPIVAAAIEDENNPARRFAIQMVLSSKEVPANSSNFPTAVEMLEKRIKEFLDGTAGENGNSVELEPRTDPDNPRLQDVARLAVVK